MSEEWVGQILKGLDRGEFPTEAEVRRLLEERRVDRDTIRILTDATIDFLHTWVEVTNHAQRAVFDDHAGQYVDR